MCAERSPSEVSECSIPECSPAPKLRGPLHFSTWQRGNPTLAGGTHHRLHANIHCAMGRGKRATPSSDKGDTESTDSSDIKSSLKLWNCSPNQLPAHLVWLADWLPDQDPRYITLVEKGFVIDKCGFNYFARIIVFTVVTHIS